MDISDLDKGFDSEMDSLERSWFAADRIAKAARRELEASGVTEDFARNVADVLARLDNAERLKREIMRQINALEDCLLA